MTKQHINIGQSANDKAGDPLRTAFSKVNENFDELYNHVSAGVVAGNTAPTDPGEGDLWWDSESGRIYVYYGSTWVDASPVDGAGISSTNELVNGAHTVSLGSDGVLTLPNGSTIGDGEAGVGVPITTARGTILLGNLTECAGGESHFHIMKAGQQAIDLFLGDDSNYVKLPDTGGVEISSSEIGAQHYWTFGTDGTLTLPDSATVAVGDIGVLQGLELAYDTSREQLNAAFALYSYEGDGWPAGPDSYNVLLLSTDPAIQPAWIPLAQSVRTAGEALNSALEPIYLDIQVAGHTWNFSNAGDFSVPGNKAIKGFDNLQLNVDGGGGKTAAVEIDGYNSKVLIKTITPGDGISDDTWTFGDAGELTLPVGGVIQTLTTPQVGTRLTDIPGWYRADTIAKTAGFWMDTTPQSLKDAMDATGLVDWQFNPDGSADFYTVIAAAYVEDNTILELTFDANLPLESAPYSVTSPNYSARTSSGISIIANENEWTFGTDGNLTLPNGMTIDSYGTSGVNAFVNIGGDNTRISIDNDGAPPGFSITTNAAVTARTWRFGPDGELSFPDATVQTTAWTGITGFGEGFSLTAADKIVTNKLYSTNLTQPTQHYRLELDTNGVVVLPDGSIINGSTIRGIAGTGELNYTGITIGPDTNHREESWMYVDHTGSYIATQYNTNQKLWQFKNDGSTILPSGAGFVKGDSGQLKVNDSTTLALDLRDSSGRGFYTNGDGFSLRGDGDSTWKFGTDGSLTFPDGDLKIAGNKIRNVSVVDDLSSGSEIEVSQTKTVITNGVTTSLGGGGGGPSLTSQALFEVSTNGILSSFQTINTLDDIILTGEYLTELDNLNFKIGQRVTNDLGDGSEPLVAFSGWTFSTDAPGYTKTLTFPNGAVISDTASSPGLLKKKYSGTFVLDPTWFAANAGNLIETTTINSTIQSADLEVFNAFSFEFTGYFVPPTSANYTFRAHADETFIFWIGAKALSGYTYANKDMYGNYNGTFPEQQTQSFTIALTAGEFYPIRIQWGNSAGWGRLDVFTWANDAGQANTSDFSGHIYTADTGTAQISANDNRSIILSTDNDTVNNWTFAPNGELSLPAGGDVINSTGVSQLAKRAEGSWTVTSGTNTYSFTVPMDGTYTMWVKGNIPNGIITWNATLSITNNNVPAIGTQYAWNYTGGGSPILLTTIPNQIRGTAGTISTDSTYVGTTSNRFDFGISNSSGSSQTIYYGWIKI